MKTARLAFVFSALAFVASPLFAADHVEFVLGPNPAPLEKLAAEIATEQFPKLFGVEVAVVSSLSNDAKAVVLFGSPETNPAIKTALGDKWPKISEQGIVIRSVEVSGKTGLVLGGGSPVATFWAACEFGYRNGIRYLLHEDVYPQNPVVLKLGGHEAVMEPVLKTRAWRVATDFPTGAESWSAADQAKRFRQLAKMKFNRVTIPLAPWQPFVEFEFQGMKRHVSEIFSGDDLPVDGDTPGKVAFAGAKKFENPDFVKKMADTEKLEAGIAHARALITAAHETGMSVELAISPLELPAEFKQKLDFENPFSPNDWKSSFIAQVPAEDSAQYRALQDLVQANLRAYLTTYPEIDAVCLEVHRPLRWGLNDDVNEKKRTDIFRDPKLLPWETSALALVQKVVAAEPLLQRSAKHPIELSIGQIRVGNVKDDAHLFPEGAAVLATTHERTVDLPKWETYFKQASSTDIPCRLALSLTRESAGVLPQASSQRLEATVAMLLQYGWNGFSIRQWAPGELDPPVHFLSRVSFDPKITARQAHNDLFVGITGKQPVADSLWKAFDHLEKATELLESNYYGFAYPSRAMALKLSALDTDQPWWKEVLAHYTEWSNELYRSHDAADPRSRKLLFYYAKRTEYALEYLTAAGAISASTAAEKKKDFDERAKQMDVAVEQLYNALDTLSDVVRDQSDRALIAVLAKHAYRPIAGKANEFSEAKESEK